MSFPPFGCAKVGASKKNGKDGGGEGRRHSHVRKTLRTYPMETLATQAMVICPLKSIVEDQILEVSSMGLSAGSLLKCDLQAMDRERKVQIIICIGGRCPTKGFPFFFEE